MYIRTALLTVFALTAVVGCTNVTKQNFKKFNALPSEDRAPFCEETVEQQECKQFSILDQRYQDCVAAIKGRYADMPSTEARKEWAKAQGCPVSE